MRQHHPESWLMLEDGSRFVGRSVSPGSRMGEVVFNTSMTGYQEILTDPSYRGQIVLMTQPHIGNYGTQPAAAESRRPWVEGFVARTFTVTPSGVGGEPLIHYLRRHAIPAVEGLDTRAVTRKLREHGAMKGAIVPADSDRDRVLHELAEFPPMEGRGLVHEVTCSKPYQRSPETAERCRLAVYDFGVKENILRSLTEHGAHLSVLPASTPAADCLALGVDGVVLSNGPGDPEPLGDIQVEVSHLVESGIPVLGICLGHQLLGLALGGQTFKLKFGHHGGNQPVRDVDLGTVAITSQNHGFALDARSLPADCRVTAVNLNDQTVEAFEVKGRPVYSVQYHPEGAPGPHDAASLFGKFLDAVEVSSKARANASSEARANVSSKARANLSSNALSGTG